MALGLLEQDLDRVTDGDFELAAMIGELGDGNQALRLVANVDNDVVRRDGDHGAFDDLSLDEVAHALVVQSDELVVAEGGGVLLAVRTRRRLGAFFNGLHLLGNLQCV